MAQLRRGLQSASEKAQVWVDYGRRGDIDLTTITHGLDKKDGRTWADLPLSNRFVTIERLWAQ